MFQREGDATILAAAQRYIELLKKIPELMANAEDRHFSGAPGTVYLKKLGHRALSGNDFENLVRAYGTPEDGQAFDEFVKAQTAIRDRLETTKIIGVILEQAGMTKDLFYYQAKRPNLWEPEEIISVMTVLDRLHV